jgi:hypothetical protein
MNDIKKLIETNLPFEYIKQVGTYFGEEHPSSNDALTELKKAFKANK